MSGHSGSGVPAQPGRVAIYGVGLIGGSLALALRQRKVWVSACDTDPATVAYAMQHGIADAISADPAAALQGAELAVLCVPPAAVPGLLSTLAPLLGAEQVLSDTSSIKRRVVEVARTTLGAAWPNFVPAHPVAGTEQSGVGAADAALFHNCQVILTPAPDTARRAVHQVEQLWRAVGAVAVRSMEAARHDALLAAGSHLPHLLAFALVDYLAGRADATEVLRYSAGGFADFTRIAASDPRLWTQICLANRDELLTCIRGFSDRLEALTQILDRADTAALEGFLSQAGQSRQRYVDPR